MTRLIDADKLCEEFKARQRAALRWKEKAILDDDEERKIRADATLAFLSEVKLTIDNASTVEERPQGEWIIDGHHIRCNRCNEYICNTDREGNEIPDNYCPNCGADMREADNV